MALRLAVVIQEDPISSHRAVEALRIALGLAGTVQDLIVALLNNAPLLLSKDPADVEDVEVLEQYKPAIQELGLPFLVPKGTCTRFPLDSRFSVQEVSLENLVALLCQYDRVITF
ncbi:MAG: hypothetical protein D6704_06875 [Nitrospirae bacterium]|nr:MAG: hypothetical protein D6704_06875 [Nitrospirota bacterium]